MSEAASPQKHEFQTEVRELLHLMIHSLYSNKEIFLRELVSNSADALDKVRFEGITKPELLGDDGELRINLHVDEDAGTIVITDNGIGMDKNDLMESLGTIASSGTRNCALSPDPSCTLTSVVSQPAAARKEPSAPSTRAPRVPTGSCTSARASAGNRQRASQHKSREIGIRHFIGRDPRRSCEPPRRSRRPWPR